jgi:hypothetical protein
MVMKNLLAQIDQIFVELNFTDKFEPPITSNELTILSEQLPFQIPKQLEDFYKWHNGIYEFIPGYNFLSLKETIENYSNFLAFAKDLEDENFFKETYLPIVQHQDSYYILDCDQNSDMGVYYLWVEGGGDSYRMYDSFEQMLQIIIDSYLSATFYIDEDDFFQWDAILFKKIENKYLSKELKERREDQWKEITDEAQKLLGTSSNVNDDNNLKKRSLVRRLYESYDPRAIEFLANFLNDRHPEVLSSAAYGLGELRAREYLPELIDLLKHSDESVRNLAACAIREVIVPSDRLVLKPLLSLLSDKSSLIIIHAIEALSKLKNSSTILPLIEMLSSNNRSIRSHTATALARIGGADALEALLKQKDNVIELTH